MNLSLLKKILTILTSSYYSEGTFRFISEVIEKNRKIIKRYQAIVRTAVTLDALMDSENEEEITKSNMKNIFKKNITFIFTIILCFYYIKSICRSYRNRNKWGNN